MKDARTLIRGVYAITPDECDTASLLSKVESALSGGVRLLQYRNKLASRSLALEQARALRKLTNSVAATLIVNDNIELALDVSADGVHLGRNDCGGIDLDALRRRAATSARENRQFLIGISCYDSMDAAKEASAAGADYIAFGSFFPSPTKPGATRAAMSLLLRAKEELALPVVAIGGITMENTPQLLAAGADAIAVITSLFDIANIRRQAQSFSSHFAEHV